MRFNSILITVAEITLSVSSGKGDARDDEGSVNDNLALTTYLTV